MANLKNVITAVLGLDASGMKKGAKDAEGELSKLGKATQAVGKAAAAAFAAAAAAVAAFAAVSVKEMMAFDKGMKEVFTLLPGISKGAMGAMEKDALKLSKTMGFLPEETVPALYQALSAGVPKGNVFEFLEVAGKAAVGGVTSLEVAVDGITSVVNAYGLETISAEEASDAMFTAVKLGKTTFEELSSSIAVATPIAKAAGVSFNDLAAMAAALTANGVPTAEAMTQIRSAILAMNTPTEAGLMKAKALGISFKDMAEGIKKPGGVLKVFQMLREKTGGNIGDMKTLLGRVEAVNAVMGLTEGGGKKLGHAIEEMGKKAGASGQAFGTMELSWSRAFDKMKARLKVFMVEFGQKLTPILKAIGPIIDEVFKMIEELPWHEFSDAISDLGEQIKIAFSGEGKTAIKDLVDLGFQFLMLLVKMTKGTLALYKGLADVGAIKFLIDILKDLFAIMEAIIDGWTKIGRGLSWLAGKVTGEAVAYGDAVDSKIEKMQELDAKQKEMDRESIRREKMKKMRESNVAQVEAATAMSSIEGKKELAKFLHYQLGRKISVSEMMRLYESGELSKMEGMQGQSMAMVASALGKLKEVESKEEKSLEAKGREMVTKMGLTPAMVLALQKTHAVAGATSLPELFKMLGRGTFTLEKMLENSFGKSQAQRIVAMGAKFAEQQQFLKELQSKSLAKLAESLGMSEKEMIAEYNAGRIGGPARQIISRKLNERLEIERKIMGTSKAEIEAQKKREEMLKLRNAEEAKRAQEEGEKRAEMWEKMTEEQRQAAETRPGDFQKIIDEQVARTKGEGAQAMKEQTEQQAAGTKETVKEVGAVGEAVKEGATEVAAAVGEVVFPDCVALCDETIERLGAYFVKEKGGGKIGPKDPLPFMFPGQTGWEIKEGFKIPKFRGGAAVGGAIALTHEEKMALGLIKKEEGAKRVGHQFAPPLSSSEMATNLKAAFTSIHNIDRNIAAIEKRLRGCITNQ